MTQEIWQVIPEFPNYHISNQGRVFNTRNRKVMRTSLNNHGHVRISLKSSHSPERFTRSVAVMVAEAFVEPPNWLCDSVTILDGNFSNVAAINLVWRPRWYTYLYTRQLKVPQPRHLHNLAVRNIDTGYCYNNVIEAGMMEGLLFEEIWDSTYQKKELFPYGHTFEVIQRV